MGEDVKDSVERRECIFGDEDEEDALDVLDAGLVQRDVGVANTHKEGNELWGSWTYVMSWKLYRSYKL